MLLNEGTKYNKRREKETSRKQSRNPPKPNVSKHKQIYMICKTELERKMKPGPIQCQLKLYLKLHQRQKVTTEESYASNCRDQQTGVSNARPNLVGGL